MMRCKCGEILSERDMKRGRDYICSSCYTASEEVLSAYQWEAECEIELEGPQVDADELFARLIEVHGMGEKWAEGGLQGDDDPMGFLSRLSAAYDEFLALMSQGMRPQIAAETALRVTPTPVR